MEEQNKKQIKQFAPLKEVCMGANIFSQLFASFPSEETSQVIANKFLLEELARRLNQFNGDNFKEEKFNSLKELYLKVEEFNKNLAGKTNKEVADFLKAGHDVIDKVYWQHWQVMGLE
ncbi:MAG: hypothetical protein V1692_01425 [bacterium]